MKNRENNASDDFTSQNEDLRLENLTFSIYEIRD